MINSQTGRILSFLYLCTPLGRQDARSNAPENGLTIHGVDDVELDGSPIEISYSPKENAMIEKITNIGLEFYNEINKETRSKFLAHKGTFYNAIS